MSNDKRPEQDAGATYEVGYGKPPVHSRFKPGQSGNPKGRKKGARSFSAVVSAVLREKVSVKTPRGTKKMTKMEALFQTTMNSALKGDPKAVALVLKFARETGLAGEAAGSHDVAMNELSEEDRAILERFGARHDDIGSGEVE